MMSLRQMRTVISLINFGDWRFVIESKRGGERFLVVEFNEPCIVTSTPTLQRSRKWRLSKHMTRSELVQTAFKAVLTAIEHEAREQFAYRGRAIFGPHFDVDALCELASVPGGLDAR